MATRLRRSGEPVRHIARSGATLFFKTVDRPGLTAQRLGVALLGGGVDVRGSHCWLPAEHPRQLPVRAHFGGDAVRHAACAISPSGEHVAAVLCEVAVGRPGVAAQQRYWRGAAGVGGYPAVDPEQCRVSLWKRGVDVVAKPAPVSVERGFSADFAVHVQPLSKEAHRAHPDITRARRGFGQFLRRDTDRSAFGGDVECARARSRAFSGAQ